MPLYYTSIAPCTPRVWCRRLALHCEARPHLWPLVDAMWAGDDVARMALGDSAEEAGDYLLQWWVRRVITCIRPVGTRMPARPSKTWLGAPWARWRRSISECHTYVTVLRGSN